IYIQSHLIKLARRLNLRQQAIATAQVYIKRFYLRVEIRKTNPYLIMVTALYLSCKTEETPQHIRLMLGEAARQWPELGVTETSKIGECEFALISTLGSRLILHHPYRALNELQGIFGLTAEESQLASSIINDSYITDLPLLYAPHVIAITAIFLAVVLRPANANSGLQAFSNSASGFPSSGGAGNASPSLSGSTAQSALAGFAGLKQAGPKLTKLVDWLAESQVDMEAIVDATQEMVSLYECWESYNERSVKETISKFMRDGGIK
ncbi:C/H/G cyclin, partial [Hortaea werneckii]